MYISSVQFAALYAFLDLFIAYIQRVKDMLQCIPNIYFDSRSSVEHDRSEVETFRVSMVGS